MTDITTEDVSVVDDPARPSPSPAAEPTTTTVVRYLTAADILDADDLVTEPVEVPEWGGTVMVRALTGTMRDAYVASLSMIDPRTKERVPNSTNSTAKLVARAVVNLDGSRVFTDAQVAALGQKSGGALERVSEVAARLSGLGPAADKDAEGNSEPTPSDGSTSEGQTPPESP